MIRVLRLALMCLIAFAVPIQGFAAVAMFECVPEHHGKKENASRSAVMADRVAATLQPSYEGGSSAERTRRNEAASQADHAQPLEDQGSAEEAGEGHCSPCTSCCVVAAMPCTTVELQPVPQSDFFVQRAPRGMISFLAEGLERPPRPFLV